MGPGSAAHRRRGAALRPGREGVLNQLHISNSKHAFAFPRRISPGVCSRFTPCPKKGRREGRVPAGTRKTPVQE
ncbi:hypothetical protein TM239_23160 [Bradyrhizobium sp. TM239]|nr:hypothetical protein TM239_23160 [Bradyrhizobium sp. TM239]